MNTVVTVVYEVLPYKLTNTYGVPIWFLTNPQLMRPTMLSGSGLRAPPLLVPTNDDTYLETPKIQRAHNRRARPKMSGTSQHSQIV